MIQADYNTKRAVLAVPISAPRHIIDAEIGIMDTQKRFNLLENNFISTTQIHHNSITTEISNKPEPTAPVNLLLEAANTTGIIETKEFHKLHSALPVPSMEKERRQREKKKAKKAIGSKNGANEEEQENWK